MVVLERQPDGGWLGIHELSSLHALNLGKSDHAAQAP
jgi:hypothetical protein